MVKWLCPLLVVALFAACSSAPFPGYKPIGNEVHWRLIMLGENDQVATSGDSVLLRIRIARHGEEPGSQFSTERWYPAGDSVRFMAQVLGRMHEGDSASIITRGARVPWTFLGATKPDAALDTAWLDLELSMRELKTAMEMQVAEELAHAADPGGFEQRSIADHIAQSGLTWLESGGIWYVLDKVPANKALIHSGERVTMHYKGTILATGAVVDDTHRSGQPLTFRLGDPEQVVKGLEVAVHLLREGGSGRFILPSALAFGPNGSSSGIVPPYSPLLYDVEVVQVVPDSLQVPIP